MPDNLVFITQPSNGLLNTPSAPGPVPDSDVIVTVLAVAGSVNNGTHQYVTTFITNASEGFPSSPSITVTNSAGNQQNALTGIPIGPSGTTARSIYRTKAGVPGTYYLLTTINDNTTTIYTDNTADAALGNPLIIGALAFPPAGVRVQVQSAPGVGDGAAAGFTITLTAAPGAQVFGPVVIDVNGIAEFSGVNAVTMTTANIFQLTATSTFGGLNPGPFVSAPYQVFDTSSAATQLVFTVQPSDTIPNSAVSPDVQVSIADSGANTVNANALITISNNLTAQLYTAYASNGTAVFSGASGISISTSGACILTAVTNPTTTPPPALTGISNAFTLFAATQFAFLNTPTDSLTNAPVLPSPAAPPGIRIAIEDIFSNPVPATGIIVTVTVSGTGQTFTAATVSGIASFTNITVNASGVRTLGVSGYGLIPDTSAAFNVTTANALVFTQQPADSILNNPLVTNTNLPIAVEVRDGGNVLIPVNGVTVNITVNAQVFTAATIAGVATFGTATLNPITVSAAGPWQLSASVPSPGVVPSSLSTPFTIFVATLFITPAAPPNIITDYPFNVNVQIRNSTGTVVLATVSATIILEVKQGSTTVGPPVAQFTSSGATTFVSQSISAAGSYQLKASVGTL